MLLFVVVCLWLFVSKLLSIVAVWFCLLLFGVVVGYCVLFKLFRLRYSGSTFNGFIFHVYWIYMCSAIHFAGASITMVRRRYSNAVGVFRSSSSSSPFRSIVFIIVILWTSRLVQQCIGGRVYNSIRIIRWLVVDGWWLVAVVWYRRRERPSKAVGVVRA